MQFSICFLEKNRPHFTIVLAVEKNRSQLAVDWNKIINYHFHPFAKSVETESEDALVSISKALTRRYNFLKINNLRSLLLHIYQRRSLYKGSELKQNLKSLKIRILTPKSTGFAAKSAIAARNQQSPSAPWLTSLMVAPSMIILSRN